MMAIQEEEDPVHVPVHLDYFDPLLMLCGVRKEVVYSYDVVVVFVLASVILYYYYVVVVVLASVILVGRIDSTAADGGVESCESDRVGVVRLKSGHFHDH